MLQMKRLHPDAILPTIGSPLAACYDLYALEDTSFSPGEIKVVRTGWKIQPPPGWRINIYIRSSTPLKKGFILANSVGIIDEDYRGELGIQLMNVKITQFKEKILYVDGSWHGEYKVWDMSESNKISKGDKIAQFELVPSNVAQSLAFKLQEVDELSITERGEGGFGSTGG